MSQNLAQRARLHAALTEVNHLMALATHPGTRAELSSIEELLRRTPVDEDGGDQINAFEANLAAARHRLHTIHNAIARFGRDAAVWREI